MNLVVIVLDAYRYDYIAANGNERIHTPNLDRLTETSWAFDFSFAASYPTIPHRTDALTGRTGAPFYPWKPLDCDVRTLPRALADPRHSRLTRLGELRDVAADHPDVAERLRQQGIAELDRRGTDERLIAWIASEGQTDFPADAQCTDAHPAPAAWHSYFGRLYHGGVPGQAAE